MIEVSGLTKRYAGRTVVDDMSFSVRPGRVTGFLGPNGAGKSTTMRIIMGLDRPTAGEARVCGHPYAGLPEPLRTAGALLNAGDVHDGRSAYQHLRGLAASNRLPKERVREVLGMVGLDSVQRRRVGSFSLGMRQRLGIAAALMGDPEVVVLDEPINGLDSEGIHWVRQLLLSLADEGRTVFLSSHLMSELEQTADHLVIIGRGRLIADTTLSDFLQAGSTGDVRVHTSHPEHLSAALTAEGATIRARTGQLLSVAGLPAQRIAELAVHSGVELYSLTPQQASLEDVYMRVTADAVEYRRETT